MIPTPENRSLRSRLRSIKALYLAYGFLKLVKLRAKAALCWIDDRIRYRGKLPLPPPLLRFRVHGSIGRKGFLEVGEQCARDIGGALASQGMDIRNFTKILDFGCGCGRVLRHFLGEGDPGRFTGTDIDAENIAWCANYPAKVRWTVNKPLPPTSFQDGEFDLIYAISVFTHLDEEYQESWLKELARITKPGGVLLLTVHGRHIYGNLRPEEKAIVESKGFYFKIERTGKLKLDGLPDFYQQAYHSPEYIRKTWSRYFKVLAHLERGINHHQDAVLLRKE